MPNTTKASNEKPSYAQDVGRKGFRRKRSLTRLPVSGRRTRRRRRRIAVFSVVSAGQTAGYRLTICRPAAVVPGPAHIARRSRRPSTGRKTTARSEYVPNLPGQRRARCRLNALSPTMQAAGPRYEQPGADAAQGGFECRDQADDASSQSDHRYRIAEATGRIRCAMASAYSPGRADRPMRARCTRTMKSRRDWRQARQARHRESRGCHEVQQKNCDLRHRNRPVHNLTFR